MAYLSTKPLHVPIFGWIRIHQQPQNGMGVGVAILGITEGGYAMKMIQTRYTKSFLMGVGVGYIIEKYKGDFWGGLEEIIIEQQRQDDIEKRRIVDVFGDTIGHREDTKTR